MATSIMRDEVQTLLRDEGALLLEVLPSREYEDEHVEGAVNILLKRLDRRTTSHLEKSLPTIVY